MKDTFPSIPSPPNPPVNPLPLTQSHRRSCVYHMLEASARSWREFSPLLGVKAAFRPMKTLRQALVKVKTSIPEQKKKGVVYEVPCKDCHRVYIGETKRTLKVRLYVYQQPPTHPSHQQVPQYGHNNRLVE